MKKAKALDKETGLLVGMVSARLMSEGQRHAFDYRCPEPSCDCKVHWRRAVEVKENTETRPATWVKNPSSHHIAGCFHDYERIASENRDYTYLENGALHVRINFPVGASKYDLYPMRGYLSDEQLQAAENTKHIKPFGSLKDLIRFVEKNLGPIDSDTLPDLVLHYQGKQAQFGEKIIGSLDYARLYDATLLPEGQEVTASVLAIVKPDHELDRNKRGKHRFACATQNVMIDGRKHAITPVIVCPEDDPSIAEELRTAAKSGGVMAVMARPFSQGANFSRAATPVYLTLAKDRQISVVQDTYWKEPPVSYMKDFKRRQFDMFAPPAA